MDEPTSPPPDNPPQRRSKSMEAAKARQRERIMAMSERERIELAWALGRRGAALRAAQLGEGK